MLLLASLSAWIIFTLPLGFIQPPPTSCLVRRNDSNFVLKVPEKSAAMMKREVAAPWPEDAGALAAALEHARHVRSARPHAGTGISPVEVRYAQNYQQDLHRSWVVPIFSSIVYRTEDIEKAFLLLLLLVVIGEFFSAPAITLADSAVITLLGEDADRYGHQRMFGSLGWGLAMFFVGIALDHSTSFPDHPCGPGDREKNYTICFATFSVLMGCALITATQITFRYDVPDADAVDKAPPEPPPPSHEDTLQQELAQQLHLPQLATGVATTAAAAPAPLVGKVRGPSLPLVHLRWLADHLLSASAD